MNNQVHAVGNEVTYTASGSDKSSGDAVVIGHTLGVLVCDVADGESGAAKIEGVYTLPKVSGAVFAVGEKLVWDVSAGAFDDSAATPASGDLTGAAIAVEAGTDGQTTCVVKLTPGNVTKTA